MSSHGIHTRRPLLALVAAVVLSAASLFLSAAPASAHDELVSTDPAAGATLAALPAQITLTFSGELADDEGATLIAVTDAGGVSLVAGAPVVHDTVVTQALAGAASGAVLVQWKVVSSDGHPISGEYSITVTPAPTAEPTPTPTLEPSPTAEPTPTAEPSVSATPTATAAPVESDDASPWPWVIGAIVVAGIAGAVAYLLVSRARREKALAQAKTPTEGVAGPTEGPSDDR